MAHQDIHTLKTIYTIELKLDFHSKLGNLKDKDIAMTVTQDLTPNERKTTVIPRIKLCSENYNEFAFLVCDLTRAMKIVKRKIQ